MPGDEMTTHSTDDQAAPRLRETAPRGGTVFHALVWDDDKVPVQWIENPDHPDGGYFGLGQFEQDFWDKWVPIN